MKKITEKKFKKAFSLIELSIVIVIVSIMITGVLSVSVSSINNAKIKTTNDRMKEVYKAMGNFLLVNKRLPCPAAITKVKSVDSDYGAEVGGGSGCSGEGVYQSATVSTLVYGMVPVRALGLANDMAEDGFESKFTYIVDKDMTNTFEATPTLGNATFSTGTYTSILTINDKPGGGTQAITVDAIMALISHGANKSGAFNANSATQNTRSSNADELENDATTFDNAPTPKTAAFDIIIISSSADSDVFDDIVFFKRRNDFVQDFSSMFLIPCEGDTDTGSFTANTSDVYYGQVVTSGSGCTSPAVRSRKCEAYGSWSIINDSCI
jgi:prepilin-type N-terminal cleavage/methylation domain-containing protein